MEFRDTVAWTDSSHSLDLQATVAATRLGMHECECARKSSLTRDEQLSLLKIVAMSTHLLFSLLSLLTSWSPVLRFSLRRLAILSCPCHLKVSFLNHSCLRSRYGSVNIVAILADKRLILEVLSGEQKSLSPEQRDGHTRSTVHEIYIYAG